MKAINKRKHFIFFQEEKEDLDENVSDTLAKIIRMRFNGQNRNCLELIEREQKSFNGDDIFPGYSIRFNIIYLITLFQMRAADKIKVEQIIKNLDAKLNIFIEKYSNSEIENENLVLLSYEFTQLIISLNYKYHSDFQPLLTLIESFPQKIADLDYFLGFIMAITASVYVQPRLFSDVDQSRITGMVILNFSTRKFTVMSTQQKNIHDRSAYQFLSFVSELEDNNKSKLAELILSQFPIMMNEIKISFIYRVIFNFKYLCTKEGCTTEDFNQCYSLVKKFNHQLINTNLSEEVKQLLIASMEELRTLLDDVPEGVQLQTELLFLYLQVYSSENKYNILNLFIQSKRFDDLKSIFKQPDFWPSLARQLHTQQLWNLFLSLTAETNSHAKFFLDFFILYFYSLKNMNPNQVKFFDLVTKKYPEKIAAILLPLQNLNDIFFQPDSLFWGKHILKDEKGSNIRCFDLNLIAMIQLYYHPDNLFPEIPYVIYQNYCNQKNYRPSVISFPSAVAVKQFAASYSGGLDAKTQWTLKKMIDGAIVKLFPKKVFLNKAIREHIYRAFHQMGATNQFPNPEQVKKIIGAIKLRVDNVSVVVAHLVFEINQSLFKKTGLLQLDLSLCYLSMRLQLLWVLQNGDALPDQKDLLSRADRIADWIMKAPKFVEKSQSLDEKTSATVSNFPTSKFLLLQKESSTKYTGSYKNLADTQLVLFLKPKELEKNKALTSNLSLVPA